MGCPGTLMTTLETARALIFDCDGTLTDSMPVHYVAWRATLGRYGIEFTEQRFYALAGAPSNKIIGLLAEENDLTLDVDKLADEKERAFLDLLYDLKPVTRVVALVEHNHGRRPMAVASGGFRWVVDKQLEAIGLTGKFDAIVTAEDTSRHKPEPDVFLEAARQMGVPPEECLVLEDAELGLEAAKRAGMGAIDVRDPAWGSSSV